MRSPVLLALLPLLAVAGCRTNFDDAPDGFMSAPSTAPSGMLAGPGFGAALPKPPPLETYAAPRVVVGRVVSPATSAGIYAPTARYRTGPSAYYGSVSGRSGFDSYEVQRERERGRERLEALERRQREFEESQRAAERRQDAELRAAQDRARQFEEDRRRVERRAREEEDRRRAESARPAPPPPGPPSPGGFLGQRI